MIPLFIDRQASTAKQLSDLSTSIMTSKTLLEKSNGTKLKGAEAQIESSKILADQREELEVIRASINALLNHNFEQAMQLEIKLQEREKIETTRYDEILKFTKIAAWTGIAGAILGAVSIAFQFNL